VQLIPFGHKSDEVAKFCQSALDHRDLLIEPKIPSELFLFRSVVECFNSRSILLQSLRAARISRAHQCIISTPQRFSDLVQFKSRMILHTPEHAWTMSDLNSLNVRDCIGG
jgi:hypothetical protein